MVRSKAEQVYNLSWDSENAPQILHVELRGITILDVLVNAIHRALPKQAQEKADNDRLLTKRWIWLWVEQAEKGPATLVFDDDGVRKFVQALQDSNRTRLHTCAWVGEDNLSD